MTLILPDVIVETDWLAEHLEHSNLKIIDASWYLPDMQRSPFLEYEEKHIPGAKFFDIDEITDEYSELPHMAPTVEKFISRMRSMGIAEQDTVVVYDGAGLFSAARVWWLFKHFSKDKIAVLNGGFPKWEKENRVVTSEQTAVRDKHFMAKKDDRWVRDVTQVANISKLGGAKILDARPADRFYGQAPEPREGLRSGHMPNAVSLPFSVLVDKNGQLKSRGDIKKIFERAGVNLSQPVITSCGSGVTAAILNLGLSYIGHQDHALYDGSWSEWGMYDDLNVVGPEDA